MQRTQRQFTLHRSTIAAIAVSDDLQRVATGDSSAAPMLCVWEPENMELLHVVSHGLPGPVRTLNFSPCGWKLLVVCDNRDRGSTIGVYDLRAEAWDYRTRCEERCKDAWYVCLLCEWSVQSSF